MATRRLSGAVARESQQREQVRCHRDPRTSNVTAATLQQQHRRKAAHLNHPRRRPAPTASVHSRGVRAGRGVNVIPVGDRAFLLTMTAGDAVHLSRETGPDETGRGAVPGWHLRPSRVNSRVRWRAYNRAALAEPRWAETTLCGRQWIAMAGAEDGDADESGDEVFAPTCRRCLAIMDRLFPEPVLDDRFPLIVQIITDTVAEHGYAEMRNVPGDQHAALRKQVRSAVRQRTGHGLQTLVHENMVVFICEPISQQHAAEHVRAAAEAMNSFLTQEPATPMPTPWRLSWYTWATS
jgi:hypothetical protein